LLNAQSTSGWTRSLLTDRTFIENKGQFDRLNGSAGAKVQYAVDEGAVRVLFTNEGLTYRLEHRQKNFYRNRGDRSQPRMIFYSDLVHMTWEGANPAAKLVAEDVASHTHTYASLNADRSVTDMGGIQGYQRLVYKDIYPGIDVVYTIHPETGIKYTLVLRPGADPSHIKMRFADDRKMILDAGGNLLIATEFGDIVDHAPLTYLEGSEHETIPSRFTRKGNTIGFSVDAYDHDRTLVIDPWTQTPPAPNSNRIWDVDVDNASNVYIYGGDSPMRLRKYDPTGNLLWTYNTPWDTSGYWIGSMVSNPSGDCFITAGTDPRVARISTAGNQVWSANGGGLDEFWRIAFNCDYTQLIMGGTKLTIGPSLSPIGYGHVFNINVNSGAVIAGVNVAATSPSFLINNPNEVRALCASPNKKFYFLTLDTIGSINLDLTLNYRQNNTYAFSYQVAAFGPTNMGINGIVATDCHIYTQNGATVHKRDIQSGSIIATAAIPGGSTTNQLGANSVQNSGVAVDSCGFVYVGSGNGVYKFDENLNLITSVNTPGAVYDVGVNHNGEIVACGNGFVTSVNLSSCAPPLVECFDPLELTNPSPLCVTDAPIQLQATIPGGTWSGPGITDPSNGTFSPSVAGAGTHTISYTVPNPLPCTLGGVITMDILVGTCTALQVCSETNGSFTVSGGVGPYEWQNESTVEDCSACLFGCAIPPGCALQTTQWTTFATGTNIPAPAAFPIRVSDGSGTILVISNANAVQPCAACPTITVNIVDQNAPNCTAPNTGTATVLASGGTAPYTYSWSPGSLSGAAQTTLSAGIYTVTATDAGNCTGTVTVTIGQPPPSITVSIVSTTDATCAGNDGEATAESVGGTAPVTYAWTPSGGSAATATGLAAGTYTVTATDAGGCTAQATATIASAGGPTISAVDVLPTGCNPPSGSITITAAGTGLEYSIDGGTVFQAGNSFTGLATGTYDVVVRDANGCTALETATITGSSGPVLDPVLTTPSDCNAATGSITLSAPGAGLEYSIDGGTTFQSSGVFTDLPAGLYDLVVRDSNGCTTNAQASVGTLTGPTIDQVISGNPSCGSTDGTITIEASGTGIEYSIDGGATFQPSNVFTDLPAGTYDIVVASSGCQLTASVELINEAGPVIDAIVAVDPLCSGASNGTITVQASGNGPFQYSVDGGTTFVGTSTFNGLAPGTYDIVVRDPGGCESTGTAALADPVLLEVTVAVTDPGCSGACNGTATATVIGGTIGNGYQYTWPNGTGSATSAQAIGVCAGTFSMEVTDANGCTATASYTLVDALPFTIEGADATDETCQGICDGTITVDASTGVAYSIGQGAPQASPVFNGLCPGVYTITVADANGCTASIADTVVAGPVIIASFTTTPTIASTLEPNFVFTNNSTNAVSYAWDFGIYGTSTEAEPTLTLPALATEFTACLTATNAEGCTDTQCAVLIVRADLAIYVPNTFTPDGDGINDMFRVVGDPGLNENFRLGIFDRWGEEIHTSTDILEGWDGSYGGVDSQDGVYVWRVSVQDPTTAEIYNFVGHVTLLR
jgi:gliding motility-associated-like protein